MVALTLHNTTKKLLDNRRIAKKYGRGYLGMSSLGDECNRKLWYGFHFVSKQFISARTQRIFDLGHKFESIIIAELKEVGIQIYAIKDGQKIELTGIDDDQETLLGCFGHESGHTDGRGIGFPEFPKLECLVEFKSMNAASFASVKKYGYQESHPVYYAQTQRYMREKKLTKVSFICINKNNSEYHIEFADYDKSVADDLARKGRTIIMSDAPPPKAYPEGYFKCFNCDHNKVCHLGFDPEKNCRTCDFVDIADNGEWHCGNNAAKDMLSLGKCEDEYNLSLDEQKAGCVFYKKGWSL